jgi:hypothetical protein
MKHGKIVTLTLVVLVTTLVFGLIVLNAQEKALTDLKTMEIVELFFAVPLLATVFYLLISAKFDQFNSRLKKIERSLDMTVRQLEIEEEELTGEEKTLKQEIRELRNVAEGIQKTITSAKSLNKSSRKRKAR